MGRLRAMAALVVLGTLVAPGSSAHAGRPWSSTRTLLEAEFPSQPTIGFSLRGAAVVSGYDDERPYVARRERGGSFAKPRFFAGPKRASFEPILDPNGAGVLFGTYFDYAPEGELDLRDECCDRTAWTPLSPGTRVGAVAPLSPHAEHVFDTRLATDGRGGAGAAWRGLGDWHFSVRRRGGSFSAAEPLRVREESRNDYDGDVVVRPSGWAFDVWQSPDQLVVRSSQRRAGGEFAPPAEVWHVPAGSSMRVTTVRLAVGERGHLWALWDVARGHKTQLNRTIAAPRRADGSFGPVQTIARATSLFDSGTAVDHRGDLHFISTRSGGRVDTRTVTFAGRLGKAVRLVAKGASNVAIGAGAGGRAVAAWSGETGVFAAARAPGGRFRGARRLERVDGYASYPVVAVGPRRESIVAWPSPTGGGRQAVRYVVLAR